MQSAFLPYVEELKMDDGFSYVEELQMEEDEGFTFLEELGSKIE
jgi:hypothetical protein